FAPPPPDPNNDTRRKICWFCQSTVVKPAYYLGNKGIARCCLGERSLSAHTPAPRSALRVQLAPFICIRRRAAKVEG
ncbi:MAG: hypothetical protein ACI9LZ_003372, partial [Glaciecola sp.]